MGSYLAWNDTPVDAEDMIDDLAALMAPFHKDDTSINQATIYTKADEDSPSLPVASKSMAVAGTSSLNTHAKAIQKIMNMRSVGIQPVKLVFLDVPHSALDFNKEYPADWTAADNALFNNFSAISNAWAARDNTRPSGKVSITWDINKSLRKRYKMA